MSFSIKFWHKCKLFATYLHTRKHTNTSIDRKLNFNEHVTPNAKATFNEGLFYVSIWLLPFSLDEHSRTLNDLINRLHKRALSLVYNDFSSSFSELLEKDKSVTIHHRNLQTLAYEIFKVKKNMENIKGNYTDLKISYYVFHHIKILPWKFFILSPKDSLVIYP